MRFTKDHEWVVVQDGVGTVGITAYAAEAMGDVVFVELPAVGRMVAAGEEFAVVESVKAASDVYAPVSGEVTAINDEATARPELINQDPEAGGWLVRVRLADPAAVEALMDRAAYDAFLKGL